jgi:preprotein translocase subunit SecG
MPILRLAYTTQFLLTLLAVFFLWSEVGGQSHLDLMPWYLKLVLGVGAAFAVVKATAGAVSHDRVWNAQTLRWTGILLVLLIGCGLASYYVHTYGEEDEEQDDNLTSSSLIVPTPPALFVPVTGTRPQGAACYARH